MTLTLDLPIYKQTYELVSILMDYVSQFPKLHKFTVGEIILTVSFDLFEYIVKANRTVDKKVRVICLELFLNKFETLKTLIRLCSEKKIISIKQTARLAELTTSIGKQATAWKNKS